MRYWRTLTVLATAMTATCGNSTNPGGGAVETAGLLSVLTASPELGEAFGASAIALPFIFGGITETGTLGGPGGTSAVQAAQPVASQMAMEQLAVMAGPYSAVGVEGTVTVRFTGQPATTISYNNIIGYTGLTSTGVDTYVSGAFAFTGQRIRGGTGTWTQPNTTFSALPAVGHALDHAELSELIQLPQRWLPALRRRPSLRLRENQGANG